MSTITKLTTKKRIARVACLLVMTGLSTFSFAQKHHELPTPNVVGGQSAENNFPFFVNVQEPGTFGVNPYCGGSLIRPGWVLTAGHCAVDFMTGDPVAAIEVVTNSYILSNPNPNHEKITSDFIAVHPSFDINGTDLSFDIALIHLSSNSAFTPLTLPSQDDTTSCAAGALASVIGYGIFDTTDIFLQPDTLQYADIQVISNAVCNEPTRYAGGVKETMLCAGKITGTATGAGAGDSGGPLMVKVGNTWLQIGVVSWGAGPYSTANNPGIYTRVSAYKNWIDSTINAYEQSTGLKKQGKFDQPQLSVNQDELYIHFSKELPSSCTYSVYDMSGRRILSDRLVSVNQNQFVNIHTLAKGLYVLKIDAGNFTYATAKFIK